MNYILLASIAGNFAHRLVSVCQTNGLALEALFITTAANPYQKREWMEKDIALFETAGFSIQRSDIASLEKEAFEQQLAETNICIMGGGNPIYLLEKMKQKNVLSSIQKGVAEGMMYIGSSAGAVLASQNIELEKPFEDRPEATPLDSYNALGLVSFQVLPHWGDSNFQKAYLEMLQTAYTRKETVIPLRDDQAIEIRGEQMSLITHQTQK